MRTNFLQETRFVIVETQCWGYYIGKQWLTFFGGLNLIFGNFILLFTLILVYKISTAHIICENINWIFNNINLKLTCILCYFPTVMQYFHGLTRFPSGWCMSLLCVSSRPPNWIVPIIARPVGCSYVFSCFVTYNRWTNFVNKILNFRSLIGFVQLVQIIQRFCTENCQNWLKCFKLQ